MDEIRFNLSLTLQQARAIKEAASDRRDEIEGALSSPRDTHDQWLMDTLDAVLVKLDDLGVTLD